MNPNGLNPEKAEDSYTLHSYGIAYWDVKTLEWHLEENPHLALEELKQLVDCGTAYLKDERSRIVKVSKTISYEEFNETD